MMSDQYAAGLFDGEGSVIINKIGVKYHGYALGCTMHLTHEAAISALHAEYGGSLNTVKRLTASSSKPLWTWKASGVSAVGFLTRVLPFLIIKREQAEHGLAFHAATRNLRGLGETERDEELRRRSEGKRHMQVLNQSRHVAA